MAKRYCYSTIVNKNDGGLLIVDYGYFNKKMFNTLQSVKNHKKIDILNNVGSSDINHLLNYKFIENLLKELAYLTVTIMAYGLIQQIIKI